MRWGMGGVLSVLVSGRGVMGRGNVLVNHLGCWGLEGVRGGEKDEGETKVGWVGGVEDNREAR